MNKRKYYEQPTAEIEHFLIGDSITTSPGTQDDYDDEDDLGGGIHGYIEF